MKAKSTVLGSQGAPGLHAHLGIEEIVRAQRMACDGATLHEIAEALNREPREVLRVMEQDQPDQGNAGGQKRASTTRIKARW